MRTNKKKLAALAMSVVMAASTMSLSAFAEEVADVTEVTQESDAQQEPTVAAVNSDWRYVEGSLSISNTGAVTWTVKDANGLAADETRSGQATNVKETPATCKQARQITWSIESLSIPGYTGDKTFVREYGDKLEHTYGSAEWKIESYGDCKTGESGLRKKVQICSVCGDERETGETESIAAEHNYGDAVITYEAVDNVIIVDGKPVLKDSKKSGTYYEISTKTCTKCGHELVSGKDTLKTLEAEVGTYAYTTVVEKSNSNIKDYSKLLSKTTGFIDEKYLAGGKLTDDAKALVVLSDCSKAGTLVLEKIDVNGNSLGEVKESIPVHHVEGVVEVTGKTTADQALIQTVTKDGKIVGVTSKSCSKTADYVWVVKCASNGEVISRTEGIAQPAGKHTPKETATAAVKALQTSAMQNGGYATQEAYDIFIKAADTADSGIKYSASIDCEKGGTVTITYVCNECGKDMTGEDDVVTVNVGKLKHAEAAQKKEENRVEPTCTTAGSYDSVTYCKYCGTTMHTQKVTLKALGHTNEKDGDKNASIKFTGSVVVDDNGSLLLAGVGAVLDDNFVGGGLIGLLQSYGVQADAVSACERCGEDAVVGTPTVTIVAIQKQALKGAGSITLKASYNKIKDNNKEITDTITVPYYSDLAAYFDKNPDAERIEGLQMDADGVVRYYKNSEFQADYAGIAEYNGGEFFVANGVVCSKANGLNEYNGTWYYLANGQIQRGYDGLALYDGAWFYLKNGVLDENISGLVPYNGGTFLFTNGRLRNDVNGLWQNSDGTWYFLALGQVQTQHTGVAIYDGAAFYVQNGKLAKDYKGTVQYDGATFKVVNGQLYGPVA